MHTASPPPTPREPEAAYLRVAAQQQPLLLQQADEVVADSRLEGGGKRNSAHRDRAHLLHIASCQEVFQTLWLFYIMDSSHWPREHHWPHFTDGKIEAQGHKSRK